MKSGDFEERMRQFEYYHSLRILPDVWVVIRVDGRSFTRLTSTKFEKPFDVRFRDAIVKAAQALVKEMHGICLHRKR